MIQSPNVRSMKWLFVLLVLAFTGGPGVWTPAEAQQGRCDLWGPMPTFPEIQICAFPGAFRDSTLYRPRSCAGALGAIPTDTIDARPRTISVRFRRDRRAEARPDFGGYRVYRVTNTPDTTNMVLVRRFSKQPGDGLLWKFSSVNSSTLEFMCNGRVVHDSVVTFIDPDSSANFVKVCRRRRPQEDPMGACLSIGDSVLVKIPPPGPHDGVLTWYAITYEERNTFLDATNEEMFIPDTAGIIGPCLDPLNRDSCPNLNNKGRNITSEPVEPTSGPKADLELVRVVPNPYRGREAWDRVGTNEVHFINLPTRAKIQIFTVSGDLVREIQHDDTVRDFARWDLKNGNGVDVTSGIYIFRVETDLFTVRNRFIVIR